MRVIDVDAHFHEPKDWLKVTDPKLDEEVGPIQHMKVAMRGFWYANPLLASLPDEEKPPTNDAAMPPGFAEHLDLTEERHPDHEDDPEGRQYSAKERVKFCDEHGVDVQVLNQTFIGVHYLPAIHNRRFDLIPKIRVAWNNWAIEQVDGHTDRLLPTAQVDFGDVPGCVSELTRVRELGCRTFAVADVIVGGGMLGGPMDAQVGKSISHPDFDPIWSAAADLEMTPILHVGCTRESVNPGWAHNGQPSMATFGMLNFALGAQLGIQNTLAALALDGVFEKHPKLTWLVQEFGISWLPGLLELLDQLTELPRLEDGIYRPSKLGSSYKLPLKPSEYIRRQVRVSPLAASQSLRPLMDMIPPEILCFSTDFPHVEGTADALTICRNQISDMSEEIQRNFFGGVGELMKI